MSDEDDDLSFFQSYRGLVIAGAVIILAGGGFLVSKTLSGSHSTYSRSDDIETIRLPLPPPKPQPTPPPQQTPPPEQQQDQKMVEQQPVQDEQKEPPKEKPDAPAPLGTSITGPGGGPDLGLGSGLGGGGGDGSGGSGARSKYGWYASQVQSRVADALRGNARTRTATMNVVIRIWPDSTGRITKARLAGSTGDPSLDATIQNDILTGMQLSEPPPSDMPLPIVMRVKAQRPQ